MDVAIRNNDRYGNFFDDWPKPSNGRKIARTAPISTIFGPIEWQRHDLFPKEKSNEPNERKFLKKTKFVSNDRSGHDDQFCPKIVQIGAILAIFRPFEDFGNRFEILLFLAAYQVKRLFLLSG